MARRDERWQRLLGWMRGENVAYDLGPYRARAEQVVAAVPELEQLSDAELSSAAGEVRDRVRLQENLEGVDEQLTETFALVYESARRTLGLSAYEEQLIAAVALHQGKVVEMQTGEGKTLAAAFPTVLNAFRGLGVHVLTPNDYLARRDAAWMGPIYEMMGLTVAVVQGGEMSRAERRQAYRDADITYGTAAEIAFDFLRDNLAWGGREMVHRQFHMAIYDDIDSILIDEARNPLVVAGEDPAPPEPTDGDQAQDLAALVRGLTVDDDYATDEQQLSVFLTDSGSERVEEQLGCGSLFTPENVELLTEINLALHAEHLVARDVDYLVRDGKVQLIDEHRGRVATGRRWPHGLQGAIEEKEGVPRTPSTRHLATTTLQAVARLYPRRAGMTATAFRAAPELGALYGMEVVYIPQHRPCVREDLADAVFTHGEARDRALMAEIEKAHAAERPVLVGTGSVEASEQLGARLVEQGVPCEVLNAKNDELEADIIARAGEPGAVTISTNMAGRGTDIRLGGIDGERREQVAELGGLCVLGRGRNDSARIDDQLRGRAGRQGDPGSSRLFVSLDDALMERFGVRELLPARYHEARSDEPIDDKTVFKEIARAQRIISERNASVRKTVWICESYLEKQRRIIQQRRRTVLVGRARSVLAEAAAEEYEEARTRLGDKAVLRAEHQLMLAWIDRAWANHLARIADARESIQLMAVGVSVGTAFGSKRPMDVFRSLARDSFDELEYEIDEGVVDSFAEAEISERGVNLMALNLAPPRKTWNYVLEEQPLETRPKLRLVPTILRSVMNKLFGEKKK